MTNKKDLFECNSYEKHGNIVDSRTYQHELTCIERGNEAGDITDKFDNVVEIRFNPLEEEEST